MWLIVNADKDKRQVTDALAKQPLAYGTQVFSLADVERELELLGGRHERAARYQLGGDAGVHGPASTHGATHSTADEAPAL